jgi:hypothetical protein
MDKIVELIVVFYLISVFLRFLKKSQKGKDQSYPSPRPRQAPPITDGRKESMPFPSARRGEPTAGRKEAMPFSSAEREEPMSSPSPGWEGPMPLPSSQRSSQSLRSSSQTSLQTSPQSLRSAPQTSPQTALQRVVETPRGPVFTSKKGEDALDILAEWERRASRQKSGTQGEGAVGAEASPREVLPGKGFEAPPPSKKVEVPTSRGPMKRPGLERPWFERPGLKRTGLKRPGLETAPREVSGTARPGMPKVKEEVNPPSSAGPEISRKEIAGEEIAGEQILFLSNPAMLLQGVIMSEILRPPLARRDRFLMPYLRG